MRGWRALVIVPLAVVVLVAAAVALARRPGDPALYPPPPGARSIAIAVVNHGYHSGLVVSREALEQVATEHNLPALAAVGRRFRRFAQLEIGWGDEGFYRGVPHLSELRVVEALRALFLPGNRSVLHVVGLPAPARSSFARMPVVELALSAEGFARLARRLEASFAREANEIVEMGQALYFDGWFFRAHGAFHVFSVCNHWLAALLDAAGVPTNPVLATLPQGLFLDLSWRSGLLAD